MNNQNMYYSNYYQYYNRLNGYYNYNNSSIPTTFYQPYTQNLPNATFNNTNYENYNKNDETNEEKVDDTKKSNIRFGPLDIGDGKISILGFSIEIDDLIIIALILFLFFQTDCDYSIIIVLGLILFNISFSSFDLL